MVAGIMTTPVEYDRKYPKIRRMALRYRVHGQSVDTVCQTVSKNVGFRQPTYKDDCGMYLRSLEDHMK